MSKKSAEQLIGRRYSVPPLVFAAAFGLSLLVVAPLGCAPTEPAEPIFPADYRSTFTLVRDCRFSIEHASTIRVYVNSNGAAAYLADENPLPVGTIVVKEEFEGVDCSNDSELQVWSTMVKRAPGYDPAIGDWQYQEVAYPTRQVTINENTSCLECHTEPECVTRDYMCTVP